MLFLYLCKNYGDVIIVILISISNNIPRYVICSCLPGIGESWGNLTMLPFLSLNAVKGSQCIMWIRYWKAANSQLFPRLGLGLSIEGTTCFIFDNMQALVVSVMASGLMFQCHLSFINFEGRSDACRNLRTLLNWILLST